MQYELYRIVSWVGAVFAPASVCVCLPGSRCVYPLHVEFQSPLTLSSVLHFCGRPVWQGRVWEKRKLQDQKNAPMETIKRKEYKMERERGGGEKFDKESKLCPEERRWLFAENGGIISCFPRFPVLILGATQSLCCWGTTEMYPSVGLSPSNL